MLQLVNATIKKLQNVKNKMIVIRGLLKEVEETISTKKIKSS